MSDSKRSNHFFGGFFTGAGITVVIGGFVLWFLMNSFLYTFISWAEEHGFTLQPSGFALMNQIPLLCAVVIGLGFVGVLLGIALEMGMIRIKT